MGSSSVGNEQLPEAGRGGPRSEPTRRAILNAARKRFGEDGYDRATIRAIARDAGIDPSMVMRYYGNKEKLFEAAAAIDLRLPDMRAVPRSRLGLALARHFMELWEGSIEDDALMFLFRSALTNESAADRLRRVVFKDQVAQFVAGIAPDYVEERAGLVATQLLGVALCRYILRLDSVVAASSEALIADLGPTLQRYLVQPLRR